MLLRSQRGSVMLRAPANILQTRSEGNEHRGSVWIRCQRREVFRRKVGYELSEGVWPEADLTAVSAHKESPTRAAPRVAHRRGGCRTRPPGAGRSPEAAYLVTSTRHDEDQVVLGLRDRRHRRPASVGTYNWRSSPSRPASFTRQVPAHGWPATRKRDCIDLWLGATHRGPSRTPSRSSSR
jgi:hypothetical protein